ncbi:uncharacterized protein PHACADRAFT_208574 [Phanerochaete carnosa HHB-10118-sp]|uniref:Uncharacterized protein n=1 Tax=Phanerochaete carnosa (strain HHB-10118-sp) TaxID=650164 RepID=K5W794_PHACS|nr:uncharacterized protein PHACADRAFT_208574 [Phanerochaete carnosa HHB-10118-sp]EKM55045.1 hypothetical protein PHACADRAFT_208574 [Phanerochaete carnosa HHB-10118-sp]
MFCSKHNFRPCMHAIQPRPIRQQSLGRVLFYSWRDNAQAVYHCTTTYFKDEAQDADRLQRYSAESSSLLVQHARAKFDRAMDIMRTEGIAYDPRHKGAVLPYGNAGQLARDARRLWQHLQQVVAEDEGWVRMMDGVTEQTRLQATEMLRRIEQAWMLHDAFTVGAHKYALRWRVVGKTVVFKVRWVRRVLRPFRALA